MSVGTVPVVVNVVVLSEYVNAIETVSVEIRVQYRWIAHLLC